MKRKRITISLTVTVLFMFAGQSFGYIYLNDGGTHNINYTSTDHVFVDYLTPSMFTTVNVFEGAVFNHNLQAWGDSRINIYGGLFNDGGYLHAAEFSQITLYDGSVGGWGVTDNAQVIISGGSVRHIFVMTDSQAIVSNGSVETLRVSENSQAIVTDGSVENLFTYGNSQVKVTGGTLGDVTPTGFSHIEWSGGTINGEIFFWEEATMTIIGSDFAIDGIPIEGSTLHLRDYCSRDNIVEYHHVTGILSNGDIIDNMFAPEPCTLLLLGLGGLLIRKR